MNLACSLILALKNVSELALLLNTVRTNAKEKRTAYGAFKDKKRRQQVSSETTLPACHLLNDLHVVSLKNLQSRLNLARQERLMRQLFCGVRIDQGLTATIVLQIGTVGMVRHVRTRRETLLEEQGIGRHSLAGARR